MDKEGHKCKLKSRVCPYILLDRCKSNKVMTVMQFYWAKTECNWVLRFCYTYDFQFYPCNLVFKKKIWLQQVSKLHFWESQTHIRPLGYLSMSIISFKLDLSELHTHCLCKESYFIEARWDLETRKIPRKAAKVDAKTPKVNENGAAITIAWVFMSGTYK